MPTDQGRIELRPVLPGEAAVLARIHVEARAASAMPDSIHPLPAVERWLEGRLAGDETWVATEGGDVVGYARFGPGWLDDLYVAPAHGGRGVGSALIDVVKARLPQGFSLWVFEANERARGFYAHHGLIELERTDGHANEERAPDIRTVWPGERPLEFLRSMIDEVDLVLGDVLARRAALTRAVQAVKPTTERDAGREADIVRRVAEVVPELGRERVAIIVDAIISASLDAVR